MELLCFPSRNRSVEVGSRPGVARKRKDDEMENHF